MNYFQSKFLKGENLYIAFKRLSNYLGQSNEWYNPIGLSAFDPNLSKIGIVLKGKYIPSAIEPFPKKSDNNCNR